MVSEWAFKSKIWPRESRIGHIIQSFFSFFLSLCLSFCLYQSLGIKYRENFSLRARTPWKQGRIKVSMDCTTERLKYHESGYGWGREAWASRWDKFVCLPLAASRGPLGDIHTLSVCSYRTREGHSDITAVLFGQFLSGQAAERTWFSPPNAEPAALHRVRFQTFAFSFGKRNWRGVRWEMAKQGRFVQWLIIRKPDAFWRCYHGDRQRASSEPLMYWCQVSGSRREKENIIILTARLQSESTERHTECSALTFFFFLHLR